MEYLQILDENGTIDQTVNPHLPEDLLKVMYHIMILVRTFDERLFKLQRAGKIGTYASVKGQEASQVGSALAMEKTDWMIPSFRETGVFLTRGVDRAKIIQAWRGDTRAYKADKGCHDLPVAIPVGSQALHAMGIAWASKMRGEKTCAVSYFGDGATSEGDVHEAMNFAGLYKAPVVFICQNNQWAISTSRKFQTASETIAQKSIAHGIYGIQVDGNDVIAVYTATKEALDRARRGEGPTLIECITYRMGDHTTSDDSTKYRNPEEVKFWESRDPLNRLKLHFQKNNMWTDDYGTWVQNEVEKETEDAVQRAFAIPPPPPDDLFQYIFEKMPPDLVEEEQELREELKERPKGDAA
ncbi:MAG: pyruvate dehydrogenase (acetyl-transferring) E1 component subunit alpha [Nanoarchaeota archaeon]